MRRRLVVGGIALAVVVVAAVVLAQVDPNEGADPLTEELIEDADADGLPPFLTGDQELPPGLAKRDVLPPGLAKKQGDGTPPGQAKKEGDWTPPGQAKFSEGQARSTPFG